MRCTQETTEERRKKNHPCPAQASVRAKGRNSRFKGDEAGEHRHDIRCLAPKREKKSEMVGSRGHRWQVQRGKRKEALRRRARNTLAGPEGREEVQSLHRLEDGKKEKRRCRKKGKPRSHLPDGEKGITREGRDELPDSLYLRRRKRKKKYKRQKEKGRRSHFREYFDMSSVKEGGRKGIKKSWAITPLRGE